MQFRLGLALCWVIVTTCVSCGWSVPVRAQGPESFDVDDERVLARLAAAEREIQRLQRKLGDGVERFPPVVKSQSHVRPVAFQGEHESETLSVPAAIPTLEPLASFANFEQDDDAAFEETIPVEPYGQEADELA
ncbi:MAG: hypothetical protein MI757_21660, partial [Pirellulales bacterium]|nr:hypothetical protein [Pirellulales bacterium]